MFNVGGGEVLVIMLLALIFLGPDKLPHAAQQAGKYLSEFRRMSEGFQRELKDAMDLTPAAEHAPAATTAGPTAEPAPVATASTDEAADERIDQASPAPDDPALAPGPDPRRVAPVTIDGPASSFS